MDIHGILWFRNITMPVRFSNNHRPSWFKIILATMNFSLLVIRSSYVIHVLCHNFYDWSLPIYLFDIENFVLVLFFKEGRLLCTWFSVLKNYCIRFLAWGRFTYGNYMVQPRTPIFWVIQYHDKLFFLGRILYWHIDRSIYS